MLIGAFFIPNISGEINNIRTKKQSFDVENIFGFFPRVHGDIIIYLNLVPFGWKMIYKDHFQGSFGLTIRGTYNSSIPPQASFIFFPSEDKLRVVGNPIFFKSMSSDLDGEIVEEWWKFNDTEPWIMTDNPIFYYKEEILEMYVKQF